MSNRTTMFSHGQTYPGCGGFCGTCQLPASLRSHRWVIRHYQGEGDGLWIMVYHTVHCFSCQFDPKPLENIIFSFPFLLFPFFLFTYFPLFLLFCFSSLFPFHPFTPYRSDVSLGRF
ncbi:hypothetical protein I7I50_03618 [Histoplasma capsulatum G186AR]|uniref:Uncharacterized protein n=1 Tax=Ajellomyces capsulatus TaxID=5037 RepID=A0A8H7YPL4_AJECA|nr:hypothetical protein I7I52_04525 [Histoplasma capsulatum]QSS74714.1 hypothetical protein I7I50_03618 [Histoplasma capsulatum G186AR]